MKHAPESTVSDGVDEGRVENGGADGAGNDGGAGNGGGVTGVGNVDVAIVAVTVLVAVVVMVAIGVVVVVVVVIVVVVTVGVVLVLMIVVSSKLTGDIATPCTITVTIFLDTAALATFANSGDLNTMVTTTLPQTAAMPMMSSLVNEDPVINPRRVPILTLARDTVPQSTYSTSLIAVGTAMVIVVVVVCDGFVSSVAVVVDEEETAANQSSSRSNNRSSAPLPSSSPSSSSSAVVCTAARVVCAAGVAGVGLEVTCVSANVVLGVDFGNSALVAIATVSSQ